MRRFTVLAVSLGVLVAFLTSGQGAGAQTPTPAAAPAGRISGSITNGTAGATGVEGARVQLLALGADGRVTSTEATVEDGRFSFTPPADPNTTYVLRATYQGVSYLVDPPILLSRELMADWRSVTVYEVTPTAPALRIESTVVSVQGLDRELGELSLQREDQVTNPSDRVYLGGADGVTLRIPAPDGVIGLGETEDIDAEVRLEGLVATTTQALRPGVNLVVTRYVVRYDQASDAYRLRVTSPLPANEMEIWVPERFVDDVRAEAGGVRGADQSLQGERWRVIQRTSPAGEGESLIASIRGLTRANDPNPLIGFPGAAIGGAIALAAVVGGIVLAGRVPPRRGAVA